MTSAGAGDSRRHAGAEASSSWSRVIAGVGPSQLHGLVADIESYPRFVPGCVATRIIGNREGCTVVDNIFGLGPIRSRFISLARIEAPESIEIVSTDGPWREFRLSWRFSSAGDGARVDCHARMSFRSRLLALLAESGFQAAQSAVAVAFERRAAALYRDHGARGEGAAAATISHEEVLR